MTLGEAIVEYRRSHDLSQREFARRADLSNSLISIIERGRNPQTGKEMSPDLETYSKIALAMGISLQALFEKLGGDASVSLMSLHFDTEPDEDYYSNPSSVENVGRPKTPEARLLAKGIDKMPKAQREAIMNMMTGLYPGLFEKGNDDDDT